MSRVSKRRFAGSRTWAVLCVAAAFAGCAAEEQGSGDNNLGAQPQAGTGLAGVGVAGMAVAGTGAPVAGAAGVGAAGVGAAGVGAAGTDMLSGGTGAAGQGGAGVGGDQGMAGTGAGTGAGAGGAPSGQPLVACEAGDGSEEGCSSFTTTNGITLQLGPYGGKKEGNVGQGHEVSVALGDADGGLLCAGFAATFSQDPVRTQMLLDTMDLNFALFTVYRPANWVDGEKYPIITWGNGTCAQPEGYGALLRYVASHGFFVVAANSRWVGGGNNAMIKALDFAFAANADPASPYYGRLDTTKVGAMGHSQGGSATVTAASDPRIQSVILFNGGTQAVKPFLSISGDRDLFTANAAGLSGPVSRANKAAFLFYHMIPMTGSSDGHLTLMLQPERVAEPTVGWFKLMMFDDPAARALFVGDSCGLCNRDAEFEYGHKGL